MDVQDGELALAWANLKHVHEIVGDALAERMEAEVGLGPSEAYVLFRLANQPDGCLRMGELATRLDMAQSGITRVIDRLETRGAVIRESRSDDRRTTFAKLTPMGWELIDRIRPVFFRTVRERFGGVLADDELTQLRGLLRKIIESAGGCEEAPWDCAGRTASAAKE